MTSEKRKGNPDWEQTVSSSGRISYRKKQKASGNPSSTLTPRSDFSQEDQKEVSAQEELKDLIENASVDRWDNTINLHAVFHGDNSANTRYSLRQYNDGMVDYHFTAVVEDEDTGDLYCLNGIAVYSNMSLTSCRRVVESTVEQTVLNFDDYAVESRDELDDPELAKSYRDFIVSDEDLSRSLRGDVVSMDYIDVDFLKSDDSGRVLFRVVANQEREVVGEVAPYLVGVDLDDNGEMQNSRVYEEGYAYVDPLLGRGFVLVMKNSSENGGSSGLVGVSDGKLSVNGSVPGGRERRWYDEDDSLRPVSVSGDVVKVSRYDVVD